MRPLSHQAQNKRGPQLCGQQPHFVTLVESLVSCSLTIGSVLVQGDLVVSEDKLWLELNLIPLQVHYQLSHTFEYLW